MTRLMSPAWSAFRVALCNKTAAVTLYSYLAVLLLTGIEQEVTLSQYSYLLSAQVQVLGAIFGLVVTTTVIAAQLVSRYAQRIVSLVLGGWTIFYLVPYIVGIILPLYLLSVELSRPAVLLSLEIGVFCVVLLVPYFAVLRRRLSIQEYIDEVRNDAVHKIEEVEKEEQALLNEYRQVDRRESTAILINVYRLGDIVAEAIDRHDTGVFSYSAGALKVVGEKMMTATLATKNKNEVQREAVQISKVKELWAERFGSTLGNIARKEVKDPHAPYKLTDVLRDVGKRAADENADGATKTLIKSLRKIGEADLQQGGVGDVCVQIVRKTGALGRKGARKESEELPRAAIGVLMELIVSGAESGLDRRRDVAREGCREIYDIWEYAWKRGSAWLMTEYVEREWTQIRERSPSTIVLQAVAGEYYRRIVKFAAHKEGEMDRKLSEVGKASIVRTVYISRWLLEEFQSEKSEYIDLAETARTLSYSVQNGVKIGAYDAVRDAFNLLCEIVQEVMLPDAETHGSVWQIIEPYGYMMRQLARSGESLDELVVKGAELLEKLDTRAEEVGAPAEVRQHLAGAHQRVVQGVAAYERSHGAQIDSNMKLEIDGVVVSLTVNDKPVLLDNDFAEGIVESQ